jgi:hypothetical protein
MHAVSGVLRKSLVLWHSIKATDYLTAIAAFGAVFLWETANMTDKFATNSDAVFAPGRDMFPIVKSDTVPIDPLPKAIRCDVAGSVTCRAVDAEQDVTFNMIAGEVLAVRVQLVKMATTATLHGIS